MWLLFLFLQLSSLFLSFVLVLLARHRIRSKAIEISTAKVQGPSSQNERMGCISCDRSRSRYMYYNDHDHDPYFRIGKRERTKKKTTRYGHLSLTYLLLPDNCYKPCPVSVCIVHTYQESLNKVDKGVEIVYSRISSGNYITCMYQSAVKICDGPK